MIIKKYKHQKKQSYKLNKLLQYVRLPSILYDYDVIICYSNTNEIVGYAVVEHGYNGYNGSKNACSEYYSNVKYNLTVLEIYESEQRKGYGTFIMDNIKSIYGLNKENRMIIHCDVDVMQFYAHNGAFEVPNSYFDDEILMII